MRILGRILLVAALLFAQTAGMAHELWHASTLAADPDGDVKTPKGNPLCDFHTALGSVSAALSCAHHTISVSSQENLFPAGDEPLAPRLPFLAAQSRGPPALL